MEVGMKESKEFSNYLHGNRRAVIEDYLIKYDKNYIRSSNKDLLINQVAVQFENNDNPYRKTGSEYDDSMAMVWESYRRKFMTEKDPD